MIVPVYRRPRVVLEALDSVAAQTRPPDRLVVVDDGSGDGTAEGVEAWIAARRPAWPAHVLRQENRGQGAARNRGAEHAADCDLFAFLDSDNLLEPAFLERMTAAFEGEPRAVAATCDRWLHRRGKRRVQRLRRFHGATAADLIRLGFPGTTNTVVRASTFREIGGYDPGFAVAEDAHFMLHLGLRGHWVHVPEVLSVRREDTDEEPPVSNLPDRRLVRAQVLERFLFEDGGADVLHPRVWRVRLSRRWASAARVLVRLGRIDEALACARRAREVWPWNLVAWLQTARAKFHAKRRSATGA